MYGEIRGVFRHALVYGAASVTSSLIGFLMIPVYTRCLSPRDYGVLELLQLASNVISIILAIGFSGAVLRFYFQYDSEDDRREVVSTALIAILTLGVGATLLLLTQTAWLARVVLGKPGYARLVAVMILTNFFGITLIVPLAYLRALRRSGLYGGVALGRLVLGLALNIVFVVVLRMSVLGVLLSGLIVAFVSSVGLVGGTLRSVRLGLSRAKFGEMAAYGGPLVPASLSMFVLHFADRFFLQRMTDLNQVGIYALGYRFAMMLPLLVMEPFGLIWGAAMFAIARREDAPQIYARLFTYFFGVATVFALGVSLVVKDALKVVATPKFLAAHTVVPIVLAGLLCLAASQFFETGIHLSKRTVFRAIAVGSAAGANLLLNLLLVPRYGMMGAAWATLGSFGVLAVMAYAFGQRLYRIPFEFPRLAKLVAAAALIYWASTWLHIESVAASTAARAGLLALYPGLLYVLGFYQQDELRKAMRAGRVAAVSLWRRVWHVKRVSESAP
jgi:O-antigen/teichoic acid export membrane protein